MREIKFRGKRLDNGEWVIGNLITKESGYSYTDKYGERPSSNCWIISIDGELKLDAFAGGCSVWTHEKFIQVDPATVGQFTGLRDKNGVKIYEGDKIQKEGQTAAVIFEDGAWRVGGTILLHANTPTKAEVIGNIHDKEVVNC